MALLTRVFRPSARDETCVALRLLLYRGEAYTLPRACPGLRVLAGEAWVAHDGRDTVITAGHELRLGPSRGVAVVSAVGNSTLLFEVFARAREPRMIAPRPRRQGRPAGECA